VVQVWPFRLLKISLVAVVLTLLATAGREPGRFELPLSGVIARLVERAVSNVTDEVTATNDSTATLARSEHHLSDARPVVDPRNSEHGWTSLDFTGLSEGSE